MAKTAEVRRGDRHLMPQTAIRIPEGLIKAAKHAAVEQGCSLRAFIEDAVRSKLAYEAQKKEF